MPMGVRYRLENERKVIRVAGLIIAVLLSAVTTCLAQDTQSQKRGFTAGGSFALSDIETINTVNGNMILNFPLGRLPAGRGGASASITGYYNSKLYDTFVANLDDGSGLITSQNLLQASESGGWRYGFDYQVRVINRNDNADEPYQCVAPDGYPDQRSVYIWRVQVIFPDGGAHEFRPTGYSDISPTGQVHFSSDGFYNVSPWGEIRTLGYSCGLQCTCGFATTYDPNPFMTYYSSDGTYIRLRYERNDNWTLYFPDGSRVTGNGGGTSRIYDRNSNYVEIQHVLNYNSSGHPATLLVDQLGRSTAIEFDYANRQDFVYSSGVNGEQLRWTVKWKTIYVNRGYRTTGATDDRTRGGTSWQNFNNYPFDVVDRIILPPQSGNLTYVFGYNGNDTATASLSLGFGELTSITMPSQAQSSYQFWLESTAPPVSGQFPNTDWILKDYPTNKTLSYQAEYDGTATPIAESWQYSVNPTSSTVTAPDGGVTTETHGSTAYSNPDSGLNFSTTRPDGSVVEHVWQQNIPCAPCGARTDVGINHFIKTEFTTIKDALGNLSQTAIKDYSYDKNGNVTQTKEYDWVPYANTRGSNGPIIPAGAPLKRVTNNTYSRPTFDSSDSNSNTLDCYWNSTSPNLKNAIAASELSNGASTMARTEIFYDDPTTTGNVTQKKSWDSTKGAYSNPLTAGNSISVSMQYNQYGSPTQTTDARGTLTVLTYGPVGGVTDLYPTQTVTASGTSIARTETRAYDFSTGLVTSATDADNNVSTSTDYDVFGRPKLQKSAVGKPEETRTRTAYDDTLRRVIVYSDLNTLGDEKLVGIQHYDQLGRVRLARQLEDSTTQSPTDETAGIKVQTRYLVSGSNSYTLSSNPYRASSSSSAGSEGTMGWMRSTSDNTGRMIEVQTFGGSSLPAPWGTNTTSTGTVTTAYDANFTTVTDQAGKLRRSMTNGLGQLVRVDEPDGNGTLGATDSPVQPTSYVYDTLSNLVTVNQGSQTRSFAYSSLARLLTAANPESGTISYTYDDNGNLLSKTDARNIVSTYVYDALNRATTRSYSDGTPAVTYNYDSATITNGIGRLSSVSSSVSSYSYSGYDAMGRVLGGTQTIGAQTYSITDITYDLAGHLKTMRYPSGRTVTNTFDNAGRLQSFSGYLGDGTLRTYSTGITYASGGQMTQEQFGTTTTSVYNKLNYNTRGQLVAVLASTSGNDSTFNRGKIVNDYGTTDNNGNLKQQTVYIPNNEGNTSQTSWYQQYGYDSLNRLTQVHEYTGNTTLDWQQAYNYDRFGNRSINGISTATWGNGINNMQAAVVQNTTTNRMYAPGETEQNHPLIDYDVAGNQTKDTYSAAAVLRAYDAENRMTSETTHNSVVSGSYLYDGDGRRVKRIVGGVETRQVYGVGGELVAEYAANSSATNPQKEYGYRNGQLLVTVTAGSGTPPVFTDNPLVAGGTVIKAVHLTELRDAVNQARSRAGLAAATWTDSSLTGVAIKAVHITELRTKLDEARAALGLSAATYTDASLSGVTVKAVHISELRARVAETVTSTDVRWMVTDQLGTPRMIFDQSGSLANVSRHDYLPFGEELFANTGGRTTQLGYTNNDGARQRFTRKERDNETGLDYFLARYYSSMQGRFTSVDPANLKTKHLANPQDLNRYAYVSNNPLKYVDPDGQEKVKVVIETFIPAPDVTVMGTTFKGDYDNKGNRIEGSYRTQQVIIVETDPSKNGGNVLYEKTRDTGRSYQLDKPGGNPIADKKASGETLQAEVSRDKYGVHINASGNESNPLITSPGITGEYSVNLQSEGPQGRLRVGFAVEHDPFPAHRITVTRTESGNTTTQVYLFDPRTEGYTPWSLNPLQNNERKAGVIFIEPKKNQ